MAARPPVHHGGLGAYVTETLRAVRADGDRAADAVASSSGAVAVASSGGAVALSGCGGAAAVASCGGVARRRRRAAARLAVRAVGQSTQRS